jgi:hypothetical protein
MKGSVKTAICFASVKFLLQHIFLLNSLDCAAVPIEKLPYFSFTVESICTGLEKLAP